MLKYLVAIAFILPLLTAAEQQQPPKPQPNTTVPIIIPVAPRIDRDTTQPRPNVPAQRPAIQVPKPKVSGARPNPLITPSARQPWVSESLDLSGWSKVAPADAGITFYMPKEPTEQTRRVTVGDRELELLQYVHSMGENGAYVVMVSGLPEGQSATAEAIMRSARERVVASVRGRLLRENAVEAGDATGTELVIMAPDSTVIRQRMFVNDGRFLQLIAAGPADFVTSSDTDKYFRAFRMETSASN